MSHQVSQVKPLELDAPAKPWKASVKCGGVSQRRDGQFFSMSLHGEPHGCVAHVFHCLCLNPRAQARAEIPQLRITTDVCSWTCILLKTGRLLDPARIMKGYQMLSWYGNVTKRPMLQNTLRSVTRSPSITRIPDALVHRLQQLEPAKQGHNKHAASA